MHAIFKVSYSLRTKLWAQEIRSVLCDDRLSGGVLGTVGRGDTLTRIIVTNE